MINELHGDTSSMIWKAWENRRKRVQSATTHCLSYSVHEVEREEPRLPVRRADWPRMLTRAGTPTAVPFSSHLATL